MTDRDPAVEAIARVCHEANRGLQISFPSPGIPVALPWDDFAVESPEQADGVCEGVEKAMDGFSPAELHQSWCERKRADGWTYGEVKDAAARTHPCLVPHDQLPEEQRRKDFLFAAIVNALTGDLSYADGDNDMSRGERTILREIRELRTELQTEVAEVDAAGEAVKQEIEALDADVKEDNAELVQAGEAITTAGQKFAELKALLEKQAAGALSDAEAQQLSSLAGEVDTSLKSADTELAAHVKVLGEDTAAA